MIIHERTKTSREVRGIEGALSKELGRIAKRIRKDPMFPVNVAFLRQRYGAEVQAAIQKAIQETYLKGLDYVSEFEEIPALLSERDLQNIRQQSQFETEGFWRTITRDTLNVQTPALLRKVNVPAAMGLLSTAATTQALALATIDKARQVGDNESEVTWVTAADEKTCIICRPLHRKTWRLNDPNILYPIRDSHPNCRCRLLFKDGRELFSH